MGLASWSRNRKDPPIRRRDLVAMHVLASLANKDDGTVRGDVRTAIAYADEYERQSAQEPRP